MSEIVEQAREALADTKCSDEMMDFFRVGLVRELVAEVDSLHSWDGLMSLLDEHYPEDIFPTTEDRDTRDPGPRIVSLLRQLNAHRFFVQALVAKSQRDICPVCSYLWRECTCGVGAAKAWKADSARLSSPQTNQRPFPGVPGPMGDESTRRAQC